MGLNLPHPISRWTPKKPTHIRVNIQDIFDQREAIEVIKHYQEIMKTGNIQGHILKKFKDKKGFIENIGLNRSPTYFKIGP